VFNNQPMSVNLPKDFLYGFSQISDGTMSFKFGSTKLVRQNRQNFCQKLGIDIKNCATSQLEHKDKIIRLTNNDLGRNMLTPDYDLTADALVTSQPGLYLFTVVADCLVIILVDPQNKSLGLIHAGWQGLNLNIIPKTAAYLQNNLNSQPKNLLAIISPAIQTCCYAYESVKQSADKTWQPFLNKQADGLIHIDLINLAKQQLTKAGIKLNNIIANSACTAHNHNYYSHFRDQQQNQPDKGRFTVVAGFKYFI